MKTALRRVGEWRPTRRELLTSGVALLGVGGIAAGSVATAPTAQAAGAGWTAIQFRSVDTRLWASKPYRGQEFVVDLTEDLQGNWLITSAMAVSYNLTATGTQGAGYLSLWRYGDPWPGTSSVNWRSSGQDIANGGIVGLGSSYYAKVLVGGSAYAASDFIIDVTGYFL